MKKQNITIAVTVLLTMLSFASVQAQETDLINVTIPFQFQIANETFPAGEYHLRRSIEGAKIMFRLNGKNCRQNAYLPLTHPVKAGDYQAESKLIFNRYGNQYFLAQVWVAGRSTGAEFVKMKRERVLERETARHGDKSELVAVLAKPN